MDNRCEIGVRFDVENYGRYQSVWSSEGCC